MEASNKNDNTYKVCTMCGKVFDMWDNQEGFGFDHHVGYGSKYDLHHIKANFCCDCFDAMLDELVKRCKHNPIIEEYELLPFSEDLYDDLDDELCASGVDQNT